MEIVVGSLVALAVLGVLAVVLLRRKSKSETPVAQETCGDQDCESCLDLPGGMANSDKTLDELQAEADELQKEVDALQARYQITYQVKEVKPKKKAKKKVAKKAPAKKKKKVKAKGRK